MSRGKQSFRQSDVAKALKAVRKSGLEVQRIVFDPDGGFTIVPSELANPQIAGSANEWDNVIK
jgi:hypothetical protein